MKTPTAHRYYEFYLGRRKPPKGKVTRQKRYRFTLHQRFADGSELVWWLDTPRVGWKLNNRWMAVGKPVVHGGSPNDVPALSPRIPSTPIPQPVPLRSSQDIEIIQEDIF